MTLSVEPVADERALREFIALPLRLWPQELAVPILESSIRSWYSQKSAHPDPISLVVVRDESGRVVGRSTVHTDRRLDMKLGERLLLFGATEFETDAAATALFDHLDERAAAMGAAALFGPVSLLPNQSGGVITSGFDQRGFVDSAWNPAWVPGVYEHAGFTRWGESDTWIVNVGAAIAPEPQPGEWAAAGVRLEYGSKRRIAALIPELLELLNASFAQLAYYTPITPAEMAAATDGLAFLLDERLLLLARDARTDHAVAFVLVIPDITEFVQKVGGRLSFARQLQLLATRSRYRREAVLVIQGTDPARQGQGILSLLSRQLQVNLSARGYRALRSTYVGRDNPASTAQFARFGGRPLQGYTFYRRSVSSAAEIDTTTTEATEVTDTRPLLDQLILLASRSPSPHNTQPWSPRIVDSADLTDAHDPAELAKAGGGADGQWVEVAIIPSRTLPAGDPSFRDVVLSIGAWVESFSIGAAAAGFGVEVEALPALLRLQELPVSGPADPSAPVVRVRLVERDRDVTANPFTPDDVRARAVYRGRLAGHPETWENLADVDLPPWLSLRRLDDRAMAYLSRLGIAYTGSRRSIARELLQWLRLDPAHPRYTRDGMTDVMLGIPKPLARLAAPATRYTRLRDPLLAVAGVAGRTSESLERARILRPLAISLAESSAESPTHLVLVANARLAAADDTTQITAAMDSRIGVSEPDALQAGRALQRLWLHAHTRGLAVSPHSELIDSPLAHGLLRKRLSLGRSDVALAVFSVGVAMGEVPRSPRLTDPTGSARVAR